MIPAALKIFHNTKMNSTDLKETIGGCSSNWISEISAKLIKSITLNPTNISI